MGLSVGIIGAGFTGLSAGLKLVEEGWDVTIFEKEKEPGGLAGGFKEEGWSWTLEKYYHHIFVSDNSIKKLAKRVGQKIIFKRPKTSVLIDGNIYQLDSPTSLLSFDKLSFTDRLRAGIVILYLKLTLSWKPLEKVPAGKFIESTMGENVWKILWEPLFEKKFGKHKGEIPASWFWARIKKRSASLGYPQGGFEEFAKKVEKKIRAKRGKFQYGVEVKEIERQAKGFKIMANGTSYYFDKLICTLPSALFVEVVSNLPSWYRKNLLKIETLGAINLVLILQKKFLEEGTYWLNINEKDFPFEAVVEHTNFIEPKIYDGGYIVYVGNHLPHNHSYFGMSAGRLLDEFSPYLVKINPSFRKSWVKKALLFKAKFSEPVITLNYSKHIPPLKTPIAGLYLANMEQVYPWDRGTNYAVELGERVANQCLTDLTK